MISTPVRAQTTVNYSDGQDNSAVFSTSAPNDPTTMSIASGTATQSGVISGNGALIKAGNGTIILSAPNEYTGLTAVNGSLINNLTPTLFISNNSALGSTINGTIVNGSTASGDTGTRLQLAAGVTVTGESLTLNSDSGQRASLFFNGAGNAAWNGDITLSGLGVNALWTNSVGSTLSIGSSALNQISSSGTNLVLRGGEGSGIINSTIALGAGALQKTGSSTWTITSANNSYTGITRISVGKLVFGTIANGNSNSSIGAGTLIALGQADPSGPEARTGIMSFNGLSGGSSNRSIRLANTATPIDGAAIGVIENVVAGQLLTLSGNITATIPGSSSSLILQGAGNLLLSGDVTGSPEMTVTKDGGGTLTLSGNNTYVGDTQIVGGLLEVTSNNALGSVAGETNVGAGATLKLTGVNYWLFGHFRGI